MTTITVDTVLIERPTRYANAAGYEVNEVIIPNAASPIAGGAGQTVTVSFAFNQQNLPAALNYVIQASASQACAVSWANKAVNGFDIVLTPLSGGVTLAAGLIDLKVTWS